MMEKRIQNKNPTIANPFLASSGKAFMDLQGRQVGQFDLLKVENNIIQKLLPGTYTLVCSVNGQNYVDRIVVK